jgi:hypothetical protein
MAADNYKRQKRKALGTEEAGSWQLQFTKHFAVAVGYRCRFAVRRSASSVLNAVVVAVAVDLSAVLCGYLRFLVVPSLSPSFRS